MRTFHLQGLSQLKCPKTKAKARKVLSLKATIPIMGIMGMNPSAVGNVSHPSPQSNDSGNVCKSGTDAASSESSHYNNSRQSAGIPSTNAEADGSQNEGKRNEGASPQHSGGQGGQSGGYQRQPYNSYQKPNGNDRPDGNK
jgi:hypothetical protein